jgi:hypothetical protein
MGMPPPPPPHGPVPPPPGWQPGYSIPPQQMAVQYYVNVQRTSGFAIASMVLGIVWIYWVGSILAIIFGHIALSQIRRNPNLRGRGMAIAGVVLGYIGMAFFALGVLALAASW